MAVFLLSLAGIPPLAGFLGKFFIFAAAIEEKFYTLAVVGVLTSVVSLFYYCKILKAMYFAKGQNSEYAPVTITPGMRVGLILMSFFTFLLGLYPVPLIEIARNSVRLWLGG
jgi:NADH-quinone oxidoreductase subunit N